MPARLPSRLLLTLVFTSFAFVGCNSRTSKADIASIDDAPVAPDVPLVLSLNARNQVKIHERWVDLYSDQAQVDEYLAHKAQQYRQMHKDHGIPMEKKMLRRECVLVFPVDVIIDSELRTKTGSILRLTRLCNDHGFVKVHVRREGEETPLRMQG